MRCWIILKSNLRKSRITHQKWNKKKMQIFVAALLKFYFSGEDDSYIWLEILEWTIFQTQGKFTLKSCKNDATLSFNSEIWHVIHRVEWAKLFSSFTIHIKLPNLADTWAALNVWTPKPNIPMEKFYNFQAQI